MRDLLLRLRGELDRVGLRDVMRDRVAAETVRLSSPSPVGEPSIEMSCVGHKEII